MADIIELLPDSVANQIAAGEVIQRPASVVKELLENSVDAGSSFIQLIIKDAGKTLIQVTDDGCAMSETDSRMCFERHATSKIKKAEDLYAIRTKGFRGEAMASIAAIAQVELKSRRTDDELGTKLNTEGSIVSSQEVCSCNAGTSIAVKNLFFNVPARRKFLKSDPVETRHIIDEFQRVALAHSAIRMNFHHNQKEVFQLQSGSFRQRIVGIFGPRYNEKLVPLHEETTIVNIDGFVGKPEFAKKNRGEQFFFVNDRFIKSPYLHHAVCSAYQELIQKDSHPSYFIKLNIDPQQIDINIHPTKTEIKFEDERSLYAIIRSAVKQSLGKYNITPSLDFETETSFEIPLIKKGQPIRMPTIEVDERYNPFEASNSKYEQASATFRPKVPSNWETLYPKKEDQLAIENFPATHPNATDEPVAIPFEKGVTWQLHNKYIITQVDQGMMLIDQQKAHQRILFEQFLKNIEQSTGHSQQLLFPQTISLSPGDLEAVKEMGSELKALGFEIEEFGGNSVIIRGVPPEAKDMECSDLIGSIIEEFLTTGKKGNTRIHEDIAKTLAYKTSMRQGKKIDKAEMHNLIDQLFACDMPYFAPSGKRTVAILTLEDLDQRFRAV